MHTVLRAYAELRDEGLIEMRQGSGAFISKNVRDDARIAVLIEQLMKEAQKTGMTKPEIVQLINGTESL